MSNTSIEVMFWGVRGSVPLSGFEYIKYGGNTSCVEIRCGGRQVIFDAGTGLYALGQRTSTFHTDIFLSHTHLDHIQGLPLFMPLHKEGSNVALWAGHLLPEYTVEQVVSFLMQSPVFPMTINDVASRVEFNDFKAGEEIQNQGLNGAGIRIFTLPLNHPDRATGYRLEYGGKSICYITDIEHEPGQPNAKLLAFIQDASLLIYDSTFDDDEFAKYKGWGHSTWQEAVRLGEAANVKQVAIFHHDPGLTDTQMDARAMKLASMSDAAFISRERMRLIL